MNIISGARNEKNFSIVKRLFSRNEMGITLPLLLLIVIISIINPVFYSIDNILNVLRNVSFVFIAGIGSTYVLVSAGIDLSVGSVLALGGISCGFMMIANLPVWLSIFIGILVGGIIGCINGILISKCKIPPFIVTLGMMYFARGLVQSMTEGKPLYPFPQSFNNIGQGSFVGIPIVVLIALFLGIIAHFVLTQTAFGRSIVAIGGNAETARLSGINISKNTLIVYTIGGLCAAASGVLTVSRLGTALSNLGTGFEMQAIAACIIGGTSMFGGVGSMVGTAIGAIFMAVVANGMVLVKVSIYLQNCVIGAIIVIAVAIDQLKRKTSGKLNG